MHSEDRFQKCIIINIGLPGQLSRSNMQQNKGREKQ